MNNNIFGILIIILAALLYPFFIKPLVAEVEIERVAVSKLEETITIAEDFAKDKARLLARVEEFTDEELTKLDTILPEEIDTIRLILDIEQVALKYNLNLTREISVEDITERTRTEGDSTVPFNKLGISVNLDGSYSALLAFLTEISLSEQLLDVKSMTLSQDPDKDFVYKVTLQAYEQSSNNGK